MTVIYCIISSILIMLVLPAVTGAGLLKASGADEPKLLPSLVFGTAALWGIFTLLAVPMIALSASFRTLLICFCVIAAAAALASAAKYRDTIGKFFGEIVDYIKSSDFITLMGWIGLIFMVILVIFLRTEDADDSEFVAMAATAVKSNTLLKYEPATGLPLSYPVPKRFLAPFPLLMAVLSVLTGVPAAVFCHTVFPPFAILLCMAVYRLLSERFFKDRKEQDVFMAFLILCLIFGGYSTLSMGERLLTRSWQGKSMTCAFALPLVLYIFLTWEKKEMRLRNYLGLQFVMLGLVLPSTSSDVLVPILAAALSFSFLFGGMKLKKAAVMLSLVFSEVVFLLAYAVCALIW